MTAATLRRVTKTHLEFVDPREPTPQRIPFSYDETLRVRDLCRELGLRVEVEPKLKDWIKEQTRLRKSEFAYLASDSNLANALRGRPFQRQGVEFAVTNRNVLIADEPGLGKTIQSIASVVESGVNGSVLVVAPKTAAYVTWPHELQTWVHEVAPDDEWVVIGGKMNRLERVRALKKILMWDMKYSSSQSNTKPMRQWVIVSPNYLRFNIKLDEKGNFVYDDDKEKIIQPVREAIPALLAIDWAAIIVDEAHQTLSGATGDIKKQSAQSRGLRLLSVQDTGLRIALSGTPFRGKHENLWGILNWLEPQEYTAYWKWCEKHFYVYMDEVYGQRHVGELKSEKALAEEAGRLMIRRTKHEAAPELPPKTYGGTPLWVRGKDKGPVAVWLDMFDQQKRAYEAMVKAALVELENGTLMANGILAEMTRLKQFANSYGDIGPDDVFYPKLPSNKYDWILDFLTARGIDGKGPGESKVIIASQFTKHIFMIEDDLKKRGIESFCLTGKTTEQARGQFQRAFQSNSMAEFGENRCAPDVFLLNTKAGGVSLTLDAADDVVIIDSTFNHDDQEQVEDRAHRISRIHNVTVWNLASINSIDESILRSTWDMNQSIKQVLDGERGVKMAIKMLSETI